MKRMRILMIISLMIVVFNSGCQNNTRKTIKTSDFIQAGNNEYKRFLSFFKDELIDHFPKELPDSSGFFATGLNDTKKVSGFAVYDFMLIKQCKNIEYSNLKNKFRNVSKVIYESNKNDLLLLFSYCDRDTINGVIYEDLETAQKNLLVKENLTSAKSLPVPLFDIDTYNGKSKCGLADDFKLYVFDAKSGKYLSEKYLSTDGECLPKKWKHGFSKGVALSDTKKAIVYWVAVW